MDNGKGDQPDRFAVIINSNTKEIGVYTPVGPRGIKNYCCPPNLQNANNSKKYNQQ